MVFLQLPLLAVAAFRIMFYFVFYRNGFSLFFPPGFLEPGGWILDSFVFLGQDGLVRYHRFLRHKQELDVGWSF